MENAQRFAARHGGKSRLDEVQPDYSNLDPWVQPEFQCGHLLFDVFGGIYHSQQHVPAHGGLVAKGAHASC